MTFKKPGRPYRYTSPTLPGFGRVGPWSTGLKPKALSDAVESWLKQIAVTDPEAVQGIVDGKYSLVEAYVAEKTGRLETLKAGASDPPLSEAIRRYEKTQTDRRKLDGLRQLGNLTEKSTRLSYLADAKNITGLLATARAAGKRTNSVHRSLYAAIKGLLAFELGEERKAQITREVQFTYEDDTRHVDADPAQVACLLAACDPELRDLATAALLTGIDRGPLLKVERGHLDFERGTLRVHDTKAKSRQRTIHLSEEAERHFRLVLAKMPDTERRLFRLSDSQISNRWQAVKQATDLTIRFKDLRHVFANAWVDEGGSLNDLAEILGHTKKTTTLRYTARQATESRERMGRVADRLGLRSQHVRIADAS